MGVRYHFNSLEDFLVSTTLTVDGQLDDGWGALFPVKGREIDATVLFADIAGFSARTENLSPAETLILVNHFFCWMTAEALQGKSAIVDKYIGDEMMIVFSKEFGSADPFADALDVGRRMADRDVLCYAPHIGIASGRVIVGYAGTPVKYNCSVFGAPVTIAARCAGVRYEPKSETDLWSCSIVTPASEWDGRDFATLFPPRKIPCPDGKIQEQPVSWELMEPRSVPIKNLPDLIIREVVNRAFYMPPGDPVGWVRAAFQELLRAGCYRASAGPDVQPPPPAT
jgi:hypothetical protein